jgi:hypothetical protein
LARRVERSSWVVSQVASTSGKETILNKKMKTKKEIEQTRTWDTEANINHTAETSSRYLRDTTSALFPHPLHQLGTLTAVPFLLHTLSGDP